MNSFYKKILNESPVGYAYHKIHLDECGIPCDYEFLEVNDAFESFTGLKKNDIIGKRITEVLSGIKDSEFDWIKTYGDIAINGGTKEFEQFSDELQRSYKIKAYSNEPNYFITQFTESTSEIIWANDFNVILEMSDELLQLEKGGALDFQRITDCLKIVSGAKFVVFNLYEDDGMHYYTVAVSGDKALIKKAESMLGFEIKRIRWGLNSAIMAITKPFTITKFANVRDYAADAIPKMILYSVEKLLKVGEVFYIRITKGDLVLGDFQLFMKKGEVFDKTRIIEIIAKQVGNAITRSRVEQELIKSEQQYTFLFEYSGLAVGFYHTDGTIISFNKKAAENMGEGSIRYEGKSIYDLFPKAEADFYMGRILKASNTDSSEEYIDFVSLKSGDKWFSSIFKRITNHEGEVIGVQIISQDITVQKKAEDELREREERFSNLFERAPLGYQSLNSEGCFNEVNEAWLETLGYQRDEVVGKWFGDFLAPEYIEAFRERFPMFIAAGQIHSEFEMIHKNGERRTIAFEGRIGYKKDGSFDKTHCILKDITIEQKLGNELKESENQFRRAVDEAPIPIMLHAEDGEVLRISKTWSEITGYEQRDIPTTDIWTEKAYGNKKESVKTVIDNLYNLSERQSDGEYEIKTKDNQTRIWDFYSAHIGKLQDGRNLAMSVAIDMTERKKSQEQILRLSYHDQLTGLYNRRFYEEELRRLDVERNLPITLIMADVNGLKITNDAFGHQEGDKLLRLIAKILKTKCRSDEIVSRIGGDEFVILLPKTDAKEACKLIDRIMAAVTKESEKHSTLSMSIGYAVKTHSEESMGDVFKNAEDDMYRHKLSESSSMRSKTIDLIMNSLYEKSHREMLHSKRVSSICEQIAIQMYFPQEDIKQIMLAGLVHDIGKIGISNEILDKNGKLTDAESIEMQKHSESGYRILSAVSEFSEIAQFVLSHQEKWDGSGYPQALKGNEIPIQARIIAIADAYDAMTSDRTYRRKMSEEDAIAEIKRCAGEQFDPDIVKIFVENVMKKI